MSIFDAYAHYYDLLYRDKDYATEAEYVSNHICKQGPGAKRILELGCGTGAHAAHMASMGFTVHGVDLSDGMISSAEARKATAPDSVAEHLTFSIGDLRTIRTGSTYDAVISLFHVMCYQITYADLEAAFKTAARHLSPGGVFLFDFWYGPSVLTQKPEVCVKRLEDDFNKVIRIAEPVMHMNENVVDVNYTVFVEEKETGKIEYFSEKHRVRYLFLPEVEKILRVCGFQLVESCAWMTDCMLSNEHWAGFVVAVRDEL